MDANQLTTIIALGVYTLINGLVWVVQRNKINQLDKLLKSIETFHNIFDMKKVEDYVKLMEKRSRATAEKRIDRALAKVKEELSHESAQHIDEQYSEYIELAIRFLLTLNEERRVDFIKHNLPKTGDNLLKSIKILDKTD